LLLCFATFWLAAQTPQLQLIRMVLHQWTSAMLDVVSTTGGFMAPTMTQVQRNAIASPYLDYYLSNAIIPRFYIIMERLISVNSGYSSIANGGTGSTTQNFG